MKIQNLKMVQEPQPTPVSIVPCVSASGTDEVGPAAIAHSDASKQELEIALLRVRIQHLELVIETARNLLGSNQDRLLRRLYEVPRELVSITTQLQRLDPYTSW